MPPIFKMTKYNCDEIIKTTIRAHRLDAETMLNGWDDWLFQRIKLLSQNDTIDFMCDALNERQKELSAARWYEQN